MKIKYAFLFLFVGASLMVGCGTTSPSTAAPSTTANKGNVVTGTVTGDGYQDHKVYFKENKDLTITLESSNNSCYFNVLTASGEAIHNGSNEGNKFMGGRMGFTGYYTVRVYLMGAANSNNQKVSYTLRY